MNSLDKQKEVEHLAKLLLFAQRPPARTPVSGAGIILGMTEVEIGVLLAKNLLKPLGKPTEKAAKLFATRELFALAEDKDWLSKATQVIQAEWRSRNTARKAAGEKASPRSVVTVN